MFLLKTAESIIFFGYIVETYYNVEKNVLKSKLQSIVCFSTKHPFGMSDYSVWRFSVIHVDILKMY